MTLGATKRAEGQKPMNRWLSGAAAWLMLICFAAVLFRSNHRGHDSLPAAVEIPGTSVAADVAPPTATRVEEPRVDDAAPAQAEDVDRRISAPMISVIAVSAALGLSFDRVPDDALRTRIEDKLQESQQDKADAEKYFHDQREQVVISKLDRHDYVRLKPDDELPSNTSALVNVLRCLTDGTPVQVVVNSGESDELDKAKAACDKITQQRIADVRALLIEWNDQQGKSK